MKTSEPQAATEHAGVRADIVAAGPLPIRARLGNSGLRRLLQAKLTVNAPGDVYEQEADRVADQVMRMPVDGAGIARSPHSFVQRACRCEDELQRAADGSSVPHVDSALETSIAALAGRGEPLSDSMRNFMEPRFGADFSAVRVHTDANAHSLARAVEAKAFTVGNDVVFGAGHYEPDTDTGRHLIAHELTHTIQQRGGIQRAPDTDAASTSAPDHDAPITKITLDPAASQATFYMDAVSGTQTATHPLEASCDSKPGIYRVQVREPDRLTLRAPGAGQDRSKECVVRMEGVHLPGKLVRGSEVEVDVISGTASEFLTPLTRKRGTSMDAQTRARIGEKLLHAGVTEEDLDDYRSSGMRQAKNASEYERAIDAFLSTRQAQRAGRADEASDLVNAMGYDVSASGAARPGVDASMLDVYEQYLQFQDYRSSSSYMQAAAAPVLRPLLEAKLQQRYGFGVAEFEQRIGAFEEAFRNATLGFALNALHSAERVCWHYLREVDALDGTRRVHERAGQMVSTLNPVRASIVSQYEAAQEQTFRASQEMTVYMNGGGGQDFDEIKAHLAAATAAEKAALDRVTQTLSAFPFVAWQDFPREDLLRAKTAAGAAYIVNWYLREHIAAIAGARQQLLDNSRYIYKADTLLAAAKRHFGIAPGSVFERIVAHEVELASRMTTWEKVALILTFALIVASIVVPGAAVVAAPGLAIIGGVQAYTSLADYHEGHEMYQAGLSSVDPSQLWVIVALIGAGLDVGGAVQAFNKLPALRKAIEAFNAVRRDSRQLADALRKVPEPSDTARDAIEHSADARASAEHAPVASEVAPPPASRAESAPAPSADANAVGSGGGPRNPVLPPSGSGGGPPMSEGHRRLLERLGSGVDEALHPPIPTRTALSRHGVYRRGIRDPDAAYTLYNEAYAGAAGREVGLYHNPLTDEYAVMIGTRNSLVRPDARDGWQLIVHYHPEAGMRLPLRLPSPVDMENVLKRGFASDRVYEFIEYDVPTGPMSMGRGRTEFGLDHAYPKEPFYVTVHYPNQPPKTMRFADIDAFAKFRSEPTIVAEHGSGLLEDIVNDVRDWELRQQRSTTAAVGGGSRGAGPNAALDAAVAEAVDLFNRTRDLAQLREQLQAMPGLKDELREAILARARPQAVTPEAAEALREAERALDAAENPFTHIGDPSAGGGRILDMGAGRGGKTLTAAEISPKARVHAIEPDEDAFFNAGRDLEHRGRRDDIARIELELSTAQQVVERDGVARYGRVNLLAPDPPLPEAPATIRRFADNAEHAMDLVAPGGTLWVHTESDTAMVMLRAALERRGWAVMEFEGPRAVRSFIPTSQSRYPVGHTGSLFASDKFVAHGLIAVRPR